MTQPRYSDLVPGDLIFTIGETVVSVEPFYEDVPGYVDGTTWRQPTGEMRLTTRMAGLTSTVVVKASDLVHADGKTCGCDLL